VQLIGLMGWMDTPLRSWMYPALSAVFLALCLERLELDAWTRVRVAVVATLVVVGYWLALYVIFFLVWTEIALNRVDGVQGRYLIVVLPVAAMAVAALVNRALPGRLVAALGAAGAALGGLATIDAVLQVDWLR
jgi:uncharacterized membrane protein